MRRLPSEPPKLAGFSYLHVLGAGGFADVFLYEQNMPRRQVAVKVMLRDIVDDQVRQMFQAEANLMAQLSTHPAILTVYQAGVSADGRPYLVMELCSPTLTRRYREERMPVAEVLRISIKVGSAIETAHRAGVLHRDIKPSNILTTAYGHPVLGDFGIASTLARVRDEEAIGLSVPWSAPEVLLDEVPGSVGSEVWSFAATVYSLLAGRSPFELPGGDNSPGELMSRVARARPQPIARTDVPAGLEDSLRRAMSRRPENRPARVLELLHELQRIEVELGLVPTPVELAREEWALGSASELGERTELRPVAGARPLPRSRRRREALSARASVEASPAVAGTATRSPAAASTTRSSLVWVVAAGAALALALGITSVVVLVAALGDSGIPVVRDIRASQAGSLVEFSWSDPGVESDDRYRIRLADGSESFQSATRFAIDAEPGDRVCITVRVHRQGTSGPPSGQRCVDVEAG